MRCQIRPLLRISPGERGQKTEIFCVVTRKAGREGSGEGRVALRRLWRIQQGISVCRGRQMRKALAPTKMPGTANGSEATWESAFLREITDCHAAEGGSQ